MIKTGQSRNTGNIVDKTQNKNKQSKTKNTTQKKNDKEPEPTNKESLTWQFINKWVVSYTLVGRL